MSTNESKGKSLISRRWHVDVREMVNDYNFKLNHVHGDSGKCEFCGNKLSYVAVIEGNHLTKANTANKNYTKVYDVGLDCLGLVLGKGWAYYNVAKREIAKLKKIAAAKKRAEKYAVEYKDLIDWFNSLHPDQLKKNYFYLSMYRILTTGNRVFTENMESAIRNKMGKIHVSKEEYEEKRKHFEKEVVPKFNNLLNLIKEVDGITDEMSIYDLPKYSSYSFVLSVFDDAKKKNRLTPGQIEALNKAHVRYTKRKKWMGEKRVEIDTSNIPY
ncbi:MAG: hypothetical protein ACXAC7_24380 [Candidatus Hodarchaeales archaeon]|jgi:hypothetical protein